MTTSHIPKLSKKKIFYFFFSLTKKSRKWLLQKQKVTKIDDTDVNKILVSTEEPYGTKNSFKYFIGYNVNDVVRPLCVKLPQMAGYVKKIDDNVTMSFKINDKQLLKKV